MKAPPVLLLGGKSPVVAYLSDSMMVCVEVKWLALMTQHQTHCLSRAIPADNQSERRSEDDGFSFLWAKGANAIFISGISLERHIGGTSPLYHHPINLRCGGRVSIQDQETVRRFLLGQTSLGTYTCPTISRHTEFAEVTFAYIFAVVAPLAASCLGHNILLPKKRGRWS